MKTAEIVEQLGQQSRAQVQSVQNASQQLSHTAQKMEQNILNHGQKSIDQVRNSTENALKQGLQQPLQQCDDSLRASAQRLDKASAQLEMRLKSMEHQHKLNTWKSITASGLAIIAALVVWLGVGKSIHTEFKRSEWISKINAATEKGSLTLCEDGVICAKVKNQLLRLDK
ncbi:MAG: hypothetical protein ACRCV6_02160 [Formosimonas sp.]